MNQLSLLLLVAVLLPMSVNAGSFLCITEATGGVSYNKRQKQWEGSGFTADGKYIIKESTFETEKWKLEVRKLGSPDGPENQPDFVCREGFSNSGLLECLGFLSRFNMTKDNLRFQIESGGGFLLIGSVDGMTDDNAGDGFIQIGKCSQI